MKLTIEKNGFMKVLQRIQGIVEKRNTMPILSNALIEATNGRLNIIATDLEVYIKDSATANILEEGSITVNARKLFEIVKEMPEETITINTGKEDRVTIKSGKARFTIMGLSSKDFPGFPLIEESKLESFDNALLKELIDKTSFAVSTDETRFNINGFLLEREKTKVRMITTDGHRLAFIEKDSSKNAPNTGKESVLLPRKGVMEIRKLLDEREGDCLISVTQKNVTIKKEDTVINIRLLEGEFPDYKKVIPTDNDRRIDTDKNMLLSSLKRVSVLSTDKIKGVKFNFSKSKLILSSSSPDIGEAIEELNVDYSGEDIEIAFNARYMIDVLEVMEEQTAGIYLKDPLSPGIIRADNSNDYTYIIMPMRL
ncbi:MAG: DNA polymerase III subunit beta [Deltaproteobacteria bacterium]|nr:DNA polymerase III subunit beta [Deltaproteobacteria bacterium]